MHLESGSVPSKLARVSAGDLLLPTAPALRNDERVFSLREEHLLASHAKAEHRYQIIVVERNDNLMEFTRDMGPASDYKDVGDIFILSLFEDSVDAVMDMADAIREENQIKSWVDENAANSTLIEDAVRQEEEKRKSLLRQSHLGSSGKLIQRNR